MSSNEPEFDIASVQITNCVSRNTLVVPSVNFCAHCKIWYRCGYVGLDEESADNTDKYCCPSCHLKNVGLKTTYQTYSNQENRTLELGENCFQRSTPMYGENEEISHFRTSSSKESSLRLPCNISSYEHTENRNYSSIPGELTSHCATEVTAPVRFQNKKGNSKIPPLETCLKFLANRKDQCLKYTDLEEKLSCIRAKISNINKNLEAIDIEILKFIYDVNKAKAPGNNFETLNDYSIVEVRCILCGTNMMHRLMKGHLKKCFMEQKSDFLNQTFSKELYDPVWNLFCDHKMKRKGKCNKFKALCKLHNNCFEKDHGICAYPIVHNKYCGNENKTCFHYRWYVYKRALLDIEKLKLITKLKKLTDEENNLKLMTEL